MTTTKKRKSMNSRAAVRTFDELSNRAGMQVLFNDEEASRSKDRALYTGVIKCDMPSAHRFLMRDKLGREGVISEVLVSTDRLKFFNGHIEIGVEDVGRYRIDSYTAKSHKEYYDALDKELRRAKL